MKITLKHRDNSFKTWYTKADNLYDGIKEIIDITHEEDDTGYFFDIDDADENYLKENYVLIFDNRVGVDLRNIK